MISPSPSLITASGIHKRFNADSSNDARVVVMNSRIVKPMGFDWFEQLERAEGF